MKILCVILVLLSHLSYGQNLTSEKFGFEKPDSCIHNSHYRVTYLTGFAGTSFVYNHKILKDTIMSDIVFFAFMKEKTLLNGLSVDCDSTIFMSFPLNSIDSLRLTEIDIQLKSSKTSNSHKNYLHPNYIVFESICSKDYQMHKINLSTKDDSCVVLLKKLIYQIKNDNSFIRNELKFKNSLSAGLYSEGVVNFIIPNKLPIYGSGTPASKE